MSFKKIYTKDWRAKHTLAYYCISEPPTKPVVNFKDTKKEISSETSLRFKGFMQPLR